MDSQERRTIFAAAAMHALIQRSKPNCPRLDLARDAWEMADAMMREEVEDKDSPLALGLKHKDESE